MDMGEVKQIEIRDPRGYSVGLYVPTDRETGEYIPEEFATAVYCVSNGIASQTNAGITIERYLHMGYDVHAWVEDILFANGNGVVIGTEVMGSWCDYIRGERLIN